MSLGEMIRSKREEHDMTQQELADILHVTRQTVSRWESGSRCLDLILSKKIADTFGITLDEQGYDERTSAQRIPICRV